MGFCSKSPAVRKLKRKVVTPVRPYPKEEDAVPVYVYTKQEAIDEGWGGAGGIASAQGFWVKLKLNDTFPDYYARDGIYHTDEVIAKAAHQIAGDGTPRSHYVVHEIAHVFGWDHDADNAIMNPDVRDQRTDREYQADYEILKAEVIEHYPAVKVFMRPLE